MHGCLDDISWFQRDFSIYLVNLFDTQAGHDYIIKQKLDVGLKLPLG